MEQSSPRRVTLEEWRDINTFYKGTSKERRFAPYDGVCSACRENLVDIYNVTGRTALTGCPSCQKSYVD